MIFSPWEYVLTTLGFFVLCCLIELGICFYYIIAKVKAKSDKSVVLYIPAISYIFVILALVNMALGAEKWGPVLFGNKTTVAVGTVESIESMDILPIYWNNTDKTFSTPSYITVSGEKYYILSDNRLNVGDNITITFCDNGKTILSWQKNLTIPGGDLSVQNKGDTEDLEKNFSRQSTEQHNAVQTIILLGIILFLVIAFRKPLSKKRLLYIKSHNTFVEGLVYPRKISLATCALEILLAIFVILGFFSGSVILCVFLLVLCLCLWCVRAYIQSILVLYEQDEFTLVSMFGRKIYNRSLVCDVQYLPTKQTGCMQLRITLTNGGHISFEEMNFIGLEYFYEWLLTGKRDCLREL